MLEWEHINLSVNSIFINRNPLLCTSRVSDLKGDITSKMTRIKNCYCHSSSLAIKNYAGPNSELEFNVALQLHTIHAQNFVKISKIQKTLNISIKWKAVYSGGGGGRVSDDFL